VSTDDLHPTFRDLRRRFIPCPSGLHKATYRRLLRQRARILTELERLPSRRTWPLVRKRLRTELRNRLLRVERRLGLRVAVPAPRTWYRTGAAAGFVGVSPKTLLRWTAEGRIACERSPWGHQQRRYRRSDLVRLIKELRR
jgi:helix-turn-helix protein